MWCSNIYLLLFCFFLSYRLLYIIIISSYHIISYLTLYNLFSYLFTLDRLETIEHNICHSVTLLIIFIIIYYIHTMTIKYTIILYIYYYIMYTCNVLCHTKIILKNKIITWEGKGRVGNGRDTMKDKATT